MKVGKSLLDLLSNNPNTILLSKTAVKFNFFSNIPVANTFIELGFMISRDKIIILSMTSYSFVNGDNIN